MENSGDAWPGSASCVRDARPRPLSSQPSQPGALTYPIRTVTPGSGQYLAHVSVLLNRLQESANVGVLRYGNHTNGNFSANFEAKCFQNRLIHSLFLDYHIIITEKSALVKKKRILASVSSSSSVFRIRDPVPF